MNQAMLTALYRQSSPVNRIVLLGASNLTLSLRLVIQQIQHHCGGPSEVLAAAGHGRSYGQSSQVLIRELPGIIACDLWSQLEASDARPTYAFLTDIGNDVLYGFLPHQILQWVTWCVEQLQKHSAHIVMTNLPIVSIESLPEWRYQLFRNLFYPSCQLSRNEAVERARVVHQGLIELAAHKQFMLCGQKPEWMSMDGIHYVYWKRRVLYQHICAHFSASRDQADFAGTKKLFSQNWQQRPRFAYQKVFGKERHCPQPSGLLADRTMVSLY
ncbi:hypothetical protein [Nitrosomonas communis]|uniref:SGNH/GDSL hydrolase family protein n=1 Tax=Nitrosomonas communis TaxID=44574 RepID=A0A1I4VH66_9PROT|nr:hypothetical protein [Nitrosomonas communis]SFN00466.1 hypothetical protein SAMN05421863_10835 [Nitrosomonas communis]